MNAIDPTIAKLIDLKKRDQEARLASIMSDMRVLREKLANLSEEVAGLDLRDDGIDRISVANGYLRYVQHRREAIRRQISELERRADTVQAELRKSVFSQSML